MCLCKYMYGRLAIHVFGTYLNLMIYLVYIYITKKCMCIVCVPSNATFFKPNYLMCSFPLPNYMDMKKKNIILKYGINNDELLGT
jgi:hypothetical protein